FRHTNPCQWWAPAQDCPPPSSSLLFACSPRRLLLQPSPYPVFLIPTQPAGPQAGEPLSLPFSDGGQLNFQPTGYLQGGKQFHIHLSSSSLRVCNIRVSQSKR